MIELKKKEVELVHPWPEWIELMERLVQQNYFDHRRKAGDKLVESLGLDVQRVGNDDDGDGVEIDFNDFRTVQVACLNFGKDRFDIMRFVDLMFLFDCWLFNFCTSIVRFISLCLYVEMLMNSWWKYFHGHYGIWQIYIQRSRNKKGTFISMGQEICAITTGTIFSVHLLSFLIILALQSE